MEAAVGGLFAGVGMGGRPSGGWRDTAGPSGRTGSSLTGSRRAQEVATHAAATMQMNRFKTSDYQNYFPSTRSMTTPCEGTLAENSAPAVSSLWAQRSRIFDMRLSLRSEALSVMRAASPP